MTITDEARGLLKRLVWQGFPETGHPESEQILLGHEEHLEADALITAALDVVDAAEMLDNRMMEFNASIKLDDEYKGDLGACIMAGDATESFRKALAAFKGGGR